MTEKSSIYHYAPIDPFSLTYNMPVYNPLVVQSGGAPPPFHRNNQGSFPGCRANERELGMWVHTTRTYILAMYRLIRYSLLEDLFVYFKENSWWKKRQQLLKISLNKVETSSSIEVGQHQRVYFQYKPWLFAENMALISQTRKLNNMLELWGNKKAFEPNELKASNIEAEYMKSTEFKFSVGQRVWWWVR